MLKTLMIGAGGISRHHCAALSRIKDVSLYGIYDISVSNAEKLAAEFNVPVVTDLESAIREVDMIHLLTPPSKRVEYASLAMKNGKHVFAEKPAAMSLADALLMERLAAKTKTKYMVAFTQRFRKGYRLMKEMFENGSLGDPVQFICVRIGPGPGYDGNLGASWRTDPGLMCGMSIESLSHDIDFITSILGNVSQVDAAVAGTIPSLPAYDNNVSAILRLRNGCFATIAASWSSSLPYNCKTLIGTKGTLSLYGEAIWDLSTAKATFSDGMQRQTELNDIFLDGKAYQAENEYFISCILEDRQPHCDAKAGRETLEVSLAILRSSKERQAVSL